MRGFNLLRCGRQVQPLLDFEEPRLKVWLDSAKV